MSGMRVSNELELLYIHTVNWLNFHTSSAVITSTTRCSAIAESALQGASILAKSERLELTDNNITDIIGPIFTKYKSEYKLGIKRQRQENVMHYTNDLHDAYLRKRGVAFWKCWKSKYESGNRHVSHVNGITDVDTVAENFAMHFAKSCRDVKVSVSVSVS